MSTLLLWTVWSVAALVPAAAVVGGGPAAPPEPDAAVVFVQRRGASARLQGHKDDKLGYYSFVGIRYAEPPVGARRFQRTERRHLAGEIIATKQCSPCPQRDPRGGRVIGEEDCLCLNVFAPKMPGEEEGCPVIFFIHGGNHRSGSIAPYGGQQLAQKDTILVTAQYRLGSLGYLSSGQRDASGNLGLFDLQAAIAWINDYIEFFGGDAGRLVIMGQGSGGSTASLMALSGEGRAPSGVVAMSGAPLSPGAIKSDPARHARHVANKTGCPPEPAELLVNCLKKLPAEKIVLADLDLDMDMIDTKVFLEEISGRFGAGARVEGDDDSRGLPPIVPQPPSASLANKQQRCPLLTGVTSAETSRAVNGKYAAYLTKQLESVKDFIKNDIVGGLRGVVGSVEGLLPIQVANIQQALPLGDYYQTLFETPLSTVGGLTQIVEATGDALFNFPAYQSVKAWSAGSPAYLYSFEHVGNLSKGFHFLPGLLLTDETAKVAEGNEVVKGPAHGDELAYIFEPLDKDGKIIERDITETDKSVRESFVSLITEFAHGVNQSQKSKKSKLFEIPFSKDHDTFIKINEKITFGKDFRFCQMGLWGSITDRVTGNLCKNLIGNLLKLSSISKVLPVKPEVMIVPDLLSNQKPNRPRQQGNNGANGGLFGLPVGI